MVESMLSKQNKVFQGADGMWKALAAGDFTVDKATALNAQKEIGEDGYWGVEQTSDRIPLICRSFDRRRSREDGGYERGLYQGVTSRLLEHGEEICQISQARHMTLL